MKVLVTGSRDWPDDQYDTIYNRIAALPEGTTIIHGGARGPDSAAGNQAALLGLEVIVMKADWEKDGRGAGYIRNAKMLNLLPDWVLAFWDGKSKGTLNTIEGAALRRISLEIVTPLLPGADPLPWMPAANGLN